MTASVNRRGEIVLRTSARDKLAVKAGDVLVAVRDLRGRIVLQKRQPRRSASRNDRSYLNPAPLPPWVLRQIYRRTDSAWEKVEAESTSLSSRALSGKPLEEL